MPYDVLLPSDMIFSVNSYYFKTKQKQTIRYECCIFTKNPIHADRTGICLRTDMAIFAYHFSLIKYFAPHSEVQTGKNHLITMTARGTALWNTYLPRDIIYDHISCGVRNLAQAAWAAGPAAVVDWKPRGSKILFTQDLLFLFKFYL